MRQMLAVLCGTLLVLLGSNPNARLAGIRQPPQSCVIFDQTLWAPRDIDNSECGLDGEGDAAHVAQNRVKNNLCAGDFRTSRRAGAGHAIQLSPAPGGS